MKTITSIVLFYLLVPIIGNAEPLKITVHPNPVEVKCNGTLRLEAHVRNEYGHSLDIPVQWQVIPRFLGTVTNDGLFTAGPNEGRGVIRALVEDERHSGIGHTFVRVSLRGPKFRLFIEPQEVKTEPGTQVQFTLRMESPGRENIPRRVTWEAIPPELGTITGDGLFTAGRVIMKGRIVARVFTGDEELLAQAPLEIGDLSRHDARVALEPKVAIMKMGESKHFAAIVTDAENHPLQRKILWKVIPEFIGTVEPNGDFTAGNVPGDGRLIAEVPADPLPARDQAYIRILPGKQPPVVIRIFPKHAVVPPGETVRFERDIYNYSGEPVHLPVEWEIFPAGIGTITPDGVFRLSEILPEDVREGRVVAKCLFDGEMYHDEAHVEITGRSDQDVFIVITPERAFVPPGKSTHFHAEVFDFRDHPVDFPLEWHVYPEDMGRITPEGFYTTFEKLDPHLDHGWIIATVHTDRGEIHERVEVIVRSEKDSSPVQVHLIPEQSFAFPGKPLHLEVSVTTRDFDPIEEYRLRPFLEPPVGRMEIESSHHLRYIPPDPFDIPDDVNMITLGVHVETPLGEGGAESRIFLKWGSDLKVEVFPDNIIAVPEETVPFEVRVRDENADPVEEYKLIAFAQPAIGRVEIVDRQSIRYHTPPLREIPPDAEELIMYVLVESPFGEGGDAVHIRLKAGGDMSAEIRPAAVTLTPGQQMKFEGSIRDGKGASFAIHGDWEIDPPWLGTLTHDGLFVAGQREGEGSILFRTKEMSARAHITIIQRRPEKIRREIR
jgi:hypothetical protein